jgi:hypothetical protein
LWMGNKRWNYNVKTPFLAEPVMSRKKCKLVG